MEAISEIATSQAVWAILCIGLVGAVLKGLRKDGSEREDKIISLYEAARIESQKRESRLLDHLERSNESQEKSLEILGAIQLTQEATIGGIEKVNQVQGEMQVSLGKLEVRVGDIETHTKGGETSYLVKRNN
jgi:hypothetical protein